jgi:arginase
MIPFIGVASGVGAGNIGCGEAPLFLHRHSELLSAIEHEWIEIFFADDFPINLYDRLGSLYQTVANKVYETFKKHHYLISIGGDHSCAISTWSGVAEAVQSSGDLGLLWIDAHMDSHTPDTSESGNIHGMPLAALMGYGDPRLSQILTNRPKLLPENLVLIGARSFEQAEAALLKRLGVRVYFMEEVRKRGLQEVMREAVQKVSQNTVGYGMSVDLDALDPLYCKAVGSPVDGGLNPDELLDSFSCIHESPPLAFEVVEYNPSLDCDDLMTAKLLVRFLEKAVQFTKSSLLLPQLS